MRLFYTLLILVFSFYSISASALCPDRSKKETVWDCPWAEHTRQLKSFQSEPQKLETYFEDAVSGVSSDLKELNSGAGRSILALWGESRNVDANANAQIVPTYILELFSKLTETVVVIHGDVVHAGLEHSFGYLFSNLNTPFGYKRWRWTKPEVGEGLGLEDKIWAPDTRDGNFLANISFVMSKIALRESDSSLEMTWSESMRSMVAKSLVSKFELSSFAQVRIEESFSLASGREIVLQTDLVPFLNQDGKDNDALLVYSVRDSGTEAGRLRLVTAFPVAMGFYNRFLELPVGLVSGLKPRYNAEVPELDRQSYSGTRRRTLIMGE